MNSVFLKHRATIAVTLAVGVATWAGGIVQLQPTAAQTSTAPPTTAARAAAAAPGVSGPPAPAGFADTLRRIYSQSVSYAGLPGKGPNGQPLTTTAPMSTNAFNAMVESLTPDQMNAVFDFKPDAWSRVDAIVGTYTRTAPPATVAAQIGQAVAASAKPAPATARPALAAPGPDYAPPEPEIFQEVVCPVPALGGDDGFDLLFGFDEAHDIASILAQPFYAAGGTALAIAVGVLVAVAYALEIPAMSVELLIDTSTFCSTGASEEEKDVINHNIVNLDNTSIAMLALDNQVKTVEGQVNQLLDTRTQTIGSKLNTAQASLDTAQKQAIEESLQGGAASAIASYELPASLGGYLDSTPIGVKVIVTNAMTSLQQAHQAINPTATSSLTSANNALAAGQFKQAFGYYQAAYQALTK